MKRLYAIIGMAGVLLAPSLYASFFDGTIKLSQGSYSYGNGGEFTATMATYPPNILGAPTFQTFCIEYNEEFSPGATYSFNENFGAVAGGPGAYATDLRTGLRMDNISIGTAWLYSQFRAGTLSGYDFANTLNDRKADAGALQQAIWWLEDEPNGVRNSYINTAEDALYGQHGTAADDAAIIGDSNGKYGVIALNLFNGPYSTPVKNLQTGITWNLNQDQLAIDPSFVPEPTTIIAGALLLLPFGASTLRILRRNRAA